MTSEVFIRYVIDVQNQERKDMAIGMLADLGIEGFEETDHTLIASGKSADVQQAEVEVYLAAAGLEYERSLVQNQNWNAIWESSFVPVVVDDFAAIRANFHAPVAGVQYDLVITPKMSFGTGHHATTYLMVQLMRGLNFKGQSVFDFGTGTGILAILAEKLGAESVLAIDIDDWCVDNAIENVAQNGCKAISVKQLSEPPPAPWFNIVLANINKHILVQNMAAMHQVLFSGGFLLLSGLLAADEHDVAEAARAEGFLCLSVSEKAGWIAMLLTKAFY
ncbi:MAG: 50S ribosomal protein L11 methyltransferase [Bacteroidetes bacterium]|nr:MAG: 50S ribosomal protein L11 methyltransferase [Bacteroidota bacterium]